jgi:hypothetical protein
METRGFPQPEPVDSNVPEPVSSNVAKELPRRRSPYGAVTPAGWGVPLLEETALVCWGLAPPISVPGRFSFPNRSFRDRLCLPRPKPRLARSFSARGAGPLGPIPGLPLRGGHRPLAGRRPFRISATPCGAPVPSTRFPLSTKPLIRFPESSAPYYPAFLSECVCGAGPLRSRTRRRSGGFSPK